MQGTRTEGNINKMYKFCMWKIMCEYSLYYRYLLYILFIHIVDVILRKCTHLNSKIISYRKLGSKANKVKD